MNRKQRRIDKATGSSSRGAPEASGKMFAEAMRHQNAGELAEAERLYNAILANDPHHADSLHCLGVMALGAGKHGVAAELIRRAIEIRDDVPFYHYNLGLALGKQGKADEAAASYRRAIELKPDHADAHYNLGLVLARQGKPDEAAGSYRKAIELNGEHVGALTNLGTVLAKQKNFEGAVESYNRALAIRPDYVEARYNLERALKEQGKAAKKSKSFFGSLFGRRRCGDAEAQYKQGVALAEQGKFDAAAACFREALAGRPDYAEAHNDLGHVLNAQGNLEEALASHRRALAIRPDYADAHAALGSILSKQGNSAEAEAGLRRALEIDPKSADAHYNLGNLFYAQERLEKAAACYRKALALKPDHAGAHNNLGNVLAEQGRVDEAVACYDLALALAPRRAEIYYNRGLLKKYDAGDSGSVILESMADTAEDLPMEEQIHLWFALGKAREDAGHFDEAFDAYRQGNTLKRLTFPYDEAVARDVTEDIIRRFDKGLAMKRRSGHADETPIFIVGMPRSGTTLVEQILSSHSRVHGGGERKFLPAAIAATSGIPARGSYMKWLAGADDGDLKRMGAQYAEKLRALAPSALRITDKLPGNLLYAGLIHKILPGAKIIHVKRDPMDTCLSCYALLFKEYVPFAYDQGELGRYYRDYARLMEHWKKVLPEDTILDVRYEDIVSDLEGQARRMVGYCGLEWEDACLNFHENARPVRTASGAQVRRPLYKTAIARWKRFEKHLQPLKAAIDSK